MATKKSHTREAIHGILLLDKSLEMTSNAALQDAKRLFNAQKAGHTGSLDPLATGMLPICFGEATKFSQYLLDADKVYEVVAQLGVETTTADSEGEVTVQKPVLNVTPDRIQAILKTFLGKIEQTPPMYSALKYKGKPLYELARKGIEVERKPRPITIFSMDLLQYDNEQLSFRVHCSKGTYVRTLVEDIGKLLDCGAHVIQLRRTMVAPYRDATMYTLETLENIRKDKGPRALAALLLPVETAVQGLPTLALSNSSIFYLQSGESVRLPTPINSQFVRLYSQYGEFLGIGEVTPEGRVKPHRLLRHRGTSHADGVHNHSSFLKD